MQVDSGATDGGCVYLLQEGATQLLHIPPHVFTVLSAHDDDHHTDRHFATHTVSFRRRHGSHMLVNAHPLFSNAAYAGGCINEPLADDAPSMELTLARLRVAPRREQPDPTALHQWATFAAEHPEALDSHVWCVRRAPSYTPPAVTPARTLTLTLALTPTQVREPQAQLRPGGGAARLVRPALPTELREPRL